MIEDKSFYIRKLNELDKPSLNRHDKGGYHLLKMLDYYGFYGIQDLTLEQIKTYYEKEKSNEKRRVFKETQFNRGRLSQFKKI